MKKINILFVCVLLILPVFSVAFDSSFLRNRHDVLVLRENYLQERNRLLTEIRVNEKSRIITDNIRDRRVRTAQEEYMDVLINYHQSLRAIYNYERELFREKQNLRHNIVNNSTNTTNISVSR